MTRQRLIAVCGTGQASPAEAAVASAVGRLIAERGDVVVCGGLGGVMAAAAEGSRAGGGTSIGMLPGDDPEAASAAVSLALATGLGEMRNGLIARVCCGMVAIGGGYGTLSEIGFMLRLGRPVVGISTWQSTAPGADAPDSGMQLADSPEAAVAWLYNTLSEAV